MDKLDAFFDPAKKVCLSEAELSACRAQLMQKIEENPVRDAQKACPTEHMTDFDPSLVRSAQTVRLSTEESSRVEKTLFAFMKDHPVDMAAAVKKRERAEASTGLFSLFSFRYSSALAAVLILVLGTGSLSYAAESALPGEALYSVKIHVNEKVQTALAITPEAKAYWEAKRAERRVKEAKRLAETGRLTPEKNDTLIVAFNTHIANSHTNIQKVADEGNRERAEEIGRKTERVLREQVTVLLHDDAIAMMAENVQRAADKTVMLDSSIRNAIAMNASSSDPMATGMMMASSHTAIGTSSSSSSKHAQIAVNLTVGAEQLRQKTAHELTKMHIDGGAQVSVGPDASVTLMQTSALTKRAASSSITSGSGSSSPKNTSSLTVQSAASAGIDIHVSSSQGTPIRVDIQTDGSIDVEIVSPKKEDPIQ